MASRSLTCGVNLVRVGFSTRKWVFDLPALASDVGRMKGLIQGCDSKWVSVSLVGNQAVAALNHRYRGKPGPTDVLAFPTKAYSPPLPLLSSSLPLSDGGDKGEGDAKERFQDIFDVDLGDLIIGVPVVAKDAATLGIDVETRVRAVVAHGLAHLVGHTHDGQHDTELMQRIEAQLLGGDRGHGLISRSIAG